jgi:protein dithiol:quinone oxidoreductase
MIDAVYRSFRFQYLLGFFACIAMLAYAYYVQFDLGIEPCPLCIFQRIAVIVMGVFFLIGAVHAPRAGGRKGYALLVLLGAAAGAGVAAYHLWVQHLPPDPMAGCTPGWNYMVENFPINKVLKMAFTGHADCAEISWTFLGLAMPFWTLVAFVAIGAAAIWAGFRGTGRRGV